MLEFYLGGGPVMHVLAACSILALAFMIERLFVLFRIPDETGAEEQLENAENAIKNGGKKEAAELCTERKGVLNYIFSAVLKRHDVLIMEERETAEMRDELALTALEAGRGFLAKHLQILATIGTIAPLLGLLGTISGMIIAFAAIARVGTGDPQVVAGGISQALNTTAFGLSIAIPTIVLYRFLATRADNVLEKMEIYAYAFINTLLRSS